MNITNERVRKIIGMKLRQRRVARKLRQGDVAEDVGISIDLLRSIENGRNMGSITTLLKLCNLLEITPDDLFYDFIDIKPGTYDVFLQTQMRKISKTGKNALKDIIVHLDKNYGKQ